VNNVLTHVSRGDWTAVERSLLRIFDPATTGAELSSLEQNLVDLMQADGGETGRILKPFLRERLGQLIEAEQVGDVLAHVEILFVQSQRTAELHPLSREPAVRTSVDLAAS
jgi:hypothetical protein